MGFGAPAPPLWPPLRLTPSACTASPEGHGHRFGGLRLGPFWRPQSSLERGPACPRRALALNCSAPINDRKGAEAKDWRAGKPVRVVRNVKGRKHSKYAPTEGNRYDGIYKVSGRPACAASPVPDTPDGAPAPCRW